MGGRFSPSATRLAWGRGSLYGNPKPSQDTRVLTCPPSLCQACGPDGGWVQTQRWAGLRAGEGHGRPQPWGIASNSARPRLGLLPCRWAGQRGQVWEEGQKSLGWMSFLSQALQHTPPTRSPPPKRYLTPQIRLLAEKWEPPPSALHPRAPSLMGRRQSTPCLGSRRPRGRHSQVKGGDGSWGDAPPSARTPGAPGLRAHPAATQPFPPRGLRWLQGVFTALFPRCFRNWGPRPGEGGLLVGLWPPAPRPQPPHGPALT